jgi:hypothetical protein
MRSHGWSDVKTVSVLRAAVAVTVALLGLGLLTGCDNASSRSSSDPADWRASVCKTGSNAGLDALVEGVDAADLQVCSSADSRAGAVYISSGKYSSIDRLDYYLQQYAPFRGRPYATTTAPDGGTWAFIAFVDGIGRGDPEVALGPLRQFGLQIHGTDAPSAEQRPQAITPPVVAQPAPMSPPQQTGSSSRGISITTTTIADYIRQNGITETAVTRRGDPPGSPYLNLPSPPGWKDSGHAPSSAYGQIMSTDPRFAVDPPTITAIFARLTGDVDADSLLRYAPNELKNLPGYQAEREGPDTLKGYQAYGISGTYLKDGVRRVIAQKTVVIPGRDGMYVLQLNLNAANDGTQASVATEAFRDINNNTVITP